MHDAAGLAPLDEAGLLEDAEVLDEARERHAEWLGQRTNRALALAQPAEHGPAGRIGQRAEHRVEVLRGIVNH